MKKAVKYLIMFGIAIAGALTVYTKVYVPKHTFKIMHASNGQLQEVVQGIGNVSALHIYAITAQTGGRILKILTDEGQWVKKGGLLMVLDGVDLPQQLTVAKANLRQARYEVKALIDELKSQQAGKEMLQLTYTRYHKLNQQGFITKAEYDKARTDLQGLEATLAATTARIDSGRAAVVAATKNIAGIKEKIARLKVFAPVTGYVIAREAEVAQYVQPATPVLQIVDPNSLWVDVRIDERVSAEVKPGQQATIILRSQPGKHYLGKVKRIDAMSDSVTLERKINVAFTALPQPFFINEQAKVIIAVRQYKQVHKIPLVCVVQRQGKLGVWVVRHGRAHFIALSKIAVNDTAMAVRQDIGAAAIIVPDSHKKALREGMRIFL